MKIKLNLRFLKEKYIELPKTATTEIISPITVKKKNYLSLIQNAVEKSAIGFSLSDFLRKNNRILIIVNDATRFTPTEKAIDAIFPMIKDKDVRIIVATGAHRPPTLYELTTVILGKYYNIFRGRIILHDATNDKEVLYIGKTTRKTEVYINRIIKEVDGIIVIGSTEPHYFAGYTGGRKGIVPGIAAYSTIEQNHRWALDEQARILKLKGNPVHEDLVESVRLVLNHVNIFGINLVVDDGHNIFACVAGDIFESHYQSVKYAEQVYVRRINNLADIVIAIVPVLVIRYF